MAVALALKESGGVSVINVGGFHQHPPEKCARLACGSFLALPGFFLALPGFFLALPGFFLALPCHQHPPGSQCQPPRPPT